MKLPLDHACDLIRDVFVAWHYTRMTAPAPDHFDLLAEARRHGLGDTATLLIEVCRPAALMVRESSPLLDAQLGFALQGVDILEMTSAVERPIRYGRYHSVVSVPCGLQARDTRLPRPSGEGVLETLYLPVRYHDSERLHVFGILPGVEQLTPYPNAVPLVTQMEWVDLGAGVPASRYDQAEWFKWRPAPAG